MNLMCVLPRILFVLIVLGVFLPISLAFAEDKLADIQQRIDALNTEAAQTNDLGRLVDIASELSDLSAKLQQLTGGIPTISTMRGKTPDEEINRDIMSINSAYEQQKLIFAGYRDTSGKQVPILNARKLHGSIEVKGSNQKFPSEPPYDGGVSRTLEYTIMEDFVGCLITTEYYDPKSGKFTDKKEYSIKTISEKINAPVFSGKECIETFGTNRKVCKKWEKYDSYRIGDGNTYPAIHEWTITGSPEDGGIMLKIETPDIVFSTANNSRNSAAGCFGADIYLSNMDFGLDIEDDKLNVQQQVGGAFHGTPHCGKGSGVAANIELCKETPRCNQLESLLSKVLWALNMRDRYKAMSKVADSEAELHALVNLDLGDRYPDLDIQDRKFLEENAGGYNIHTGETLLPNLCRGCATMPLCMWDVEGLRIHEKTHELDVLANPNLKKLFTDTQYQMENYRSADEIDVAQARAWGEMERHAYDENARHLMDILQLELSRSQGCNLPPVFYVNLGKAVDVLK